MIDIIAVTYGQNEELKCFINSIKSQTSDKWKLTIIHDGPNPELESELITENYLVHDKVVFIQHPNRFNDYGHSLRKWAVENVVNNEYLLITNADNYYTPNMVEEVLRRDEDLIYFNLVHSHSNRNNNNKSTYGFMDSKLICGCVDMGNVVVKSNISKKVGFNSTEFAADWIYFDEIIKLGVTQYKINKVLFVHN